MKQQQQLPKLRLGLLTLTIVWGNVAGAYRWILPTMEKGEVTVENPTPNVSEAYLKTLQGALGNEETPLRLSSKSTTIVPVSAATTVNVIDGSPSLRLTWNSSVDSPVAMPLVSGQSNHLSVSLQGESFAGEMWLANLSSQSQDGLILSQGGQSAGQVLQSFHLNGHESLRVSGLNPLGSAFSFKAQRNLFALVKTSRGWVRATPESNHQALPQPQGVYFILANADRTQSYLVDLIDSKLIEQARLQITNPKKFLSRILIAEIGPNTLSDNRDILSATQAPWSWRIQRVHRFASVASQACDGNPQMLEDELAKWLPDQSSSANICFWSYQIIGEIPPL